MTIDAGGTERSLLSLPRVTESDLKHTPEAKYQWRVESERIANSPSTT